MNILRTERTYASPSTATYALGQAANRIGKSIADVRYVIAVTETSHVTELARFAPVVIGINDQRGESNNDFMHVGITWVA